MKEALAVVAVLVVGGIWGVFLKSSEEQMRPLSPSPSAAGGDDHGHHADHGHH